jgi:hypothetical protein
VLGLYDVEGEAFRFWFARVWEKTRPHDYYTTMSKTRLAAFDCHLRENSMDATDADIGGKDGRGRTALHWASDQDHDKVVRMLRDRGAEVNAQSGYGNALQAVSAEGHKKVVQMLLDVGAEVNAQDGRSRITLQAASAKGHDNIVRMMLEKDADAEAQSGTNGRALHVASYGGHDGVVMMELYGCCFTRTHRSMARTVTEGQRSILQRASRQRLPDGHTIESSTRQQD